METLCGTKFKRVGKFRYEFLNERSFVKWHNGDDRISIAMRFTSPRMLRGRKFWNIFTACRDYMELLLVLHPAAISVSVYLQDGLFAEPMRKYMAARHACFWDAKDASSTCDEDAMGFALDWWFIFRCALHIASSSIEWGLMYLATKELLKSVHISIASLMAGSQQYLLKVDLFVQKHVSWRPAATASCDDSVAWFWRSLDVDASMMDAFVSVNPYWNGKSLVCNKDPPGGMETILKCVMYCLRWCDFIENRWGRCGQSARLYCRSQRVGVDGLYQMIVDDEDVSMYNLSGYEGCTAAVRKFLAIAALAPRASEYFIWELMQDDRLLARATELWTGIVDEVAYLADLPLYVWRSYCKIAGGDLDPSTFRSEVLHSCLKHVAYLYQEIFHHIKEYPLCLTQGNIDERVRELELLDPAVVADYVARKIKFLLSVAHPRDQIVKALELLRDTAMTTLLAEQAHGSGAQLMNYHLLFGALALLSRSILHQTRHLPKDSQEDLRLQAAREQVDVAYSRTAKPLPARQMYLKSLAHATMSRTGDDTDVDNREAMKTCFQSHTQHFQALTPDEQQHFARLGEREKHVNARAIEEQREQADSNLQILEMRRTLKDASDKGILNRTDSCRWGDAEFTRFSEIWGSNAYGPTQLAARQEKAVEPPDAPTAPERKVLENKAKEVKKDPGEVPWWVRRVTDNRDRFVGCAVSDGGTLHNEIFIFLLGRQSPPSAVFVRAELRPNAMLEHQGVLLGGAGPALGTFTTFEFFPLTLVLHSELPFDNKDCEILVWHGLQFHGRFVLAPHAPEEFAKFTRFYPNKAAKQSARAPHQATKVSQDVRAELLARFPHLTEADIQGTPKLSKKKSRGRDDFDELPSDHGDDARSEASSAERDIGVHVSAAAAQLPATRERLGDDEASHIWFHTRTNAKNWVQQHRNVPNNESLLGTEVLCLARGGDAQQFCRLFQWPRQKGYAFLKFGGETNACTLAHEVCRLGNYYCNIWVNVGHKAENFRFEAEHVSNRPEDKFFIDWFFALPHNCHAFESAMFLRVLQPLHHSDGSRAKS